jgi:TonB-dependent starch-binding outer membrane protein SusC
MKRFVSGLKRLRLAGKRKPAWPLGAKIMAVLICLTFHASIFAQQVNISGQVFKAIDGTTLPGVNIRIKGSNSGTTTKPDGTYQITATPDQILVFSFVGFKTQEIPVGNKTVISIRLVEEVSDMEEVVVIGYGSQKKRLVTGATSHIKGDDLETRRSTNVLQALQGKAAGINITSTSGQPGEPMKVVIRGLGTIGSSNPLYIVDGVQTGDINYLNSSDIESIDVLKDAASAAIYGSRAANGVILINTKKGEKGLAQINFDSYVGFQNRPKSIDLLDAREYAIIMNEQHINSGGSIAGLPFDINNLPAYTSNGSANTDWLGQMFVKNALTHNYNISTTGGNDQTIYSMSLSYTGQDGIVGGKDESRFERYSGRFNSESNFYKNRVKVGEHVNLIYVNKNGITVGNQYYNTLRGAFNTSPLLPVYDNDGNFFNTASLTDVDQNGKTYWNNTESSPYAGMIYGNNDLTNEQRIVGDVYADIEIIKNLKFKTTLGVDYFSDESRAFTPIYQLSIYAFQNYSKASQRMSRGLALNSDNVLSYSFKRGDHDLQGMLGMSARKYSGSWMYGENANIVFNDLEHAFLDNATNQEWAKLSLEGGPNEEDRLLSYFGRVQYSLKERYLFNATLRADGSSKFAKGNRWGYFPSLSAGWVVTNEEFLPKLNWLDFFKIRASWGQNGNQGISAFQYLAPIKFTQATYAFGSVEGISTPGTYPSRLAYENLKWETSEQLNIGFDSRILKNKMGIDFDWYYKTTKDWLIIAPVLATAGADAPYTNGGDVLNAGVELQLSYTDKAGAFNYSVGLNGAYNKNVVLDVPTEDGIIHGATNTLYNNSLEFYRAETGHPIGFFWGYQTDGLFQNTNEVNTYLNSDGKIIQPKAKPGDVRYVDQNDDGVIDESDKVEIGDPNPDFIYGLTFSATYRAFDFLFVANGVAGNQIVQSYRNHTNKYANYTTAILDRWTGEGTSDRIPRVTNANVNYLFSDLFVQDGSYLRISNITIGLDISKLTDKVHFAQFRVYAQVQNLFTLTSYDGMDPEIGYGFDNGATDRFSSGIDLGYYPRPRIILFGVSVKF